MIGSWTCHYSWEWRGNGSDMNETSGILDLCFEVWNRHGIDTSVTNISAFFLKKIIAIFWFDVKILMLMSYTLHNEVYHVLKVWISWMLLCDSLSLKKWRAIRSFFPIRYKDIGYCALWHASHAAKQTVPQSNQPHSPIRCPKSKISRNLFGTKDNLLMK